MPELPTGCESVSSVMLLHHEGFDIDKCEFTEEYLRCDYYKSEDMYSEYFFGNPFSIYGSFCEPSVCVDAIREYFSELNYEKLSPVDLTGENFSFLLNLVRQGSPVAIWMTIDYTEPSFKQNEYDVTVYNSSHCIVLKGYDFTRGIVLINDPLLGIIEKDITLIEDIYNKSNKRALCLI